MPSNPFNLVTVSPNFALGHAIQWDIDSGFVESEPYEFVVEVSGVPDFTEIQYTLPPTDSFFILDDTKFKEATFIDIYYRVRLTTGDHNTYYSPVVEFGRILEYRRPYKIASEIVRKEFLRMKRYTGTPGYLLKRKAFGQVRKDSVDPISGVPITDNTSSFGTSFENGYFKPIKVLFSYEDRKFTRILNQTGMGVNDVKDVSLRLPGFPTVGTHDIIIDTDEDSRYLVKTATAITYPGTSIDMVQKLEASLIPPTDPVYQILIPNVDVYRAK